MLGKPSAKMQARFLSYSLQTICKKGKFKTVYSIILLNILILKIKFFISLKVELK